MIIRGHIKKGDKVSHVCSGCDGEIIYDAIIGGESLYKVLDERFDLDVEVDWNHSSYGNKDNPQKNKYEDLEKTGISYLILDDDPGNRSYEDIVGEWVVKKLYTEHITGCYSEWTCGMGGYDYFIDGGHNILTEILSFEGKYVLLNLKDFREVQIDLIIGE